MKNNYGIDRVIEPAGTVTVSAWKIDNSPALRPGEARVRLQRVHIDWDSFRQICSSCAYDDERVRAKILYFVQRRGKLHNPFTNSGGTFSGTVEKIYDGTELPDGIGYGVTVVAHKNKRSGISENEIRSMLIPLVRHLYFLDLSEPHNAFGYLLKKEFKSGFMDAVLVTDNVYGAETLAALSVRSHGLLYFDLMRNNSSNAMLVAEGLGKVVSIAAPDNSAENYDRFTLGLIRGMKQRREQLEDAGGSVNYYEIMDAQEKRLIEYALTKGGTTRRAAEIIGLSHSTFARKKQKHGL